MTNWQAFWCVVAVFIIAEAALTMRGIDTMLWQFKTPAEKVIQQRLAGGCTP